jgi:RNA polymerase sigma factor (sigma-70 family)
VPPGDDERLGQQYLESLPFIQAAVRQLARQYRLSPDEAEECVAEARLRLLEADYEVLRKFEGRSSLRTYLTTVVTRLFLDRRVKAWGKWRPSVEARRLGPTAIALERLTTRDQMSLDQAIDTLLARGETMTDAALRSMAERLPHRIVRRVEDMRALEKVPAFGPSSDHLVADADAAALTRQAQIALTGALRNLSARERLMLRLRFEQGSTVAHISRVLHEPQKALYRQFERLLGVLRDDLVAQGISVDHLRWFDPDGVGHSVPGKSGSRSVSKDDGPVAG